MSRSKSLYVPQKDEINDAIRIVLDETPNALSSTSAKDVKKAIEKENPNWSVPERRVSKYLKRQLKHMKATGHLAQAVADDVSVSTASSTGSRARKVLASAGTSLSTLSRRKPDDSNSIAVSSLGMESHHNVTSGKGIKSKIGQIFKRSSSSNKKFDTPPEIRVPSPTNGSGTHSFFVDEQETRDLAPPMIDTLLPPIENDEDEHDIEVISPRFEKHSTNADTTIHEVDAYASISPTPTEDSTVIADDETIASSGGEEIELETREVDVEVAKHTETANTIDVYIDVYCDDNDGKSEEGCCGFKSTVPFFGLFSS